MDAGVRGESEEPEESWEAEDKDQTALAECMEAISLVESTVEPDDNTPVVVSLGPVLNSSGHSEPRSGEDEEEEEDDDVGWITPQNVKAVYKQLGLEKEEPQATDKVGCLTGDFSVQVRILYKPYSKTNIQIIFNLKNEEKKWWKMIKNDKKW